MEPIIISVQNVGKTRGTRIYLNSKDINRIKRLYGEDFFLFRHKKLLAHINPIRESIEITNIDSVEPSSNFTTLEQDPSLMSNGIDIENLDIGTFTDLGEYETNEQSLEFYLPIEGTGEEYWIGEIIIDNKLAFYCVSSTLPKLKKKIDMEADKNFPNLLNFTETRINIIKDFLVFSPVPGFIAKNAYKKVVKKRINEVEIEPEISIPNDAKLMPIVDMGNGKLNGLKIKKREILAKYEIEAIASKYGEIETLQLTKLDDKIVWECKLKEDIFYFDIIQGEEINLIKEKVISV